MTTSGNGLDALRPVERALVEHVERGELLDLAGDEPVDEAAMRQWGESRTIRAHVVRDILRGRLAPDPDPHGLWLRGARIEGRVDLENVTSTVVLDLSNCLLDEGLIARDAHLPALVLTGCRLEHPSEPVLDAGRFTAIALAVRRTTIIGYSNDSVMNVAGAHLHGLQCDGAVLRNDSGPALYAEGLRVDGSVFLCDGFEATGSGELGAVRLRGAHIGDLECRGAILRNDSGPALYAEGLQVDGSVLLRDGFEATGSGDLGTVRLLGAHIRGGLNCVRATWRNDSGPALYADGLQVDRGVFLRYGFEAIGAVRLLGAHIGGQLDCSRAVLRNESGPALAADSLQVDLHVFLSDGFKATGTGELGAVRLSGAHLHGLQCDGAVLRNDSGPALAADSLQVDLHVLLSDGFEATGTGESGTVRLSGAHIRGLLDCSRAVLRNDSGPALHADNLQVDRGVSLSDGFEATGAGQHVAVNLTDLRVGGVLVFDPARLEHLTDPQARLAVDGLTYSGLPLGISPESWLELLHDGAPSYAAQPYQQLAAAHRAAGHDREARRVLMTQRRDQIRRRALTGRAERAWARLTGVTLGYGYQPWRALLGLLTVVTVAVVLAVVLGGHGGLAQVRTPPTPTPLGCTVVERFGVGLDLGTPLITTTGRGRCEATDTTTGQILTITGWALRLLAWAFATLFIAGFTGAVRKT